MNDRKQTNYNEVVGITTDGEIILCNYLFEHGDMRGATGSVLIPLTQDCVDDRNDVDNLKGNYDYLWQEEVAAGQTELGMEEWLEELIDSEINYGEGYFFGHDTSDIHHITDEFHEKYFPGAVTFECVGGGRCFGRDIEFATIINPTLWEAIQDIEGLQSEPTLKLIK
jgi:hypothetical protein